MPIFDVLAVLGALAIGLIGASAIRYASVRRRAADPERQAAEQRALGARNVARLQLEEARRCAVCEQLTEPTIDLYMNDAWYHRTCYQTLTAEALKEDS